MNVAKINVLYKGKQEIKRKLTSLNEIFSEIFYRPQKGEKSLRLTAAEIVQEMIRGNARHYYVAMNNNDRHLTDTCKTLKSRLSD